MLRFGPSHGPLVLVAPALFEEANRTRAFTVSILRLLAERGIASALPDLPGQGESVVLTHEVTLAHWQEAFEAAADTVGHHRAIASTVSIRGGALVDLPACGPARWQFAPSEGKDLLKNLWRIRQTGRGVKSVPCDPHRFIGESGGPVEIGGNLLSPDLLASLASASPYSSVEGIGRRVVRLDSDPRPADRKVAGSPLWRRAEPGNDSLLAQLLANDIADWVRTCGG